MSEATVTTGGSVLRGGFWYAASRLVPQFYTLAISIVAARFLGPDGMGRQSLIAFVELSLVALLSNGMFFALMRWVGEAVGRRQSAALGAVLRWAWLTTGLLALLGTAILVVVGQLGATPRNAWYLAAAVCFTGTLHAVPTAVLIGLQLWRQAAMVGLVTGLVATGAVIAVLAAGGGITGMFAVEAAISVANLAWTSTLARRALALDAGASRETALTLRRSVTRAALVLTVSEVLALVVERRSEIFFLAHYAGDAQIALYSIVFSLVTALLQLPLAMAAAISPAVATLFGEGARDRIAAGYARALRLLLTGVAVLTALGLTIGPALIRVVYGDAYRETRPVLLVMMSAFPIMAAGGAANAFLTGVGRLRALLGASAIAAVVDIGLAAVLVPGHNAVGAAFANLGAQVALTLAVLLAVRATVGGVRWEPVVLIRAAVAALFAAAVAWAAVAFLGDVAGVVVGLVGGLVVYVIAGSALKILAADDAAWIEEHAGHYVGGSVGRVARLFARRRPDAPVVA